MMTLVAAIADEAAYGPERLDDRLPRGDAPLALIDYDPLLVLTLKASHGRWRDDKSYALCRFLGAPVIDRTQSGIIDVGLNVRSLYPIPRFDPSFNAELSELMADRARELLAARVKRGAERIVLLWSGGIDSTAALCAFLRATDGDAASRRLLHVRCSPRSVVENPSFFHDVLVPAAGGATEASDGGKSDDAAVDATHVAFGDGITLEHTPEHAPDALDAGREPMVVAGDSADMLFCTCHITEAFTSATVKDCRGRVVNNPMWMSLDAPWRRVMPACLHVRGLLLNPDDDADDRDAYARASREWCAWIAPHVARAPIAIETTFDFLWWLAYSCTYQFDVLKVLRDRESAAEIRAVFEGFTPFFAHPSFDQWSFHNHASKMGSHLVWASYKLPLKRYISELFDDAEYFSSKTAVSPARTRCGRQVAITAEFEPVAFGCHSLSLRRMAQKYGKDGLDRLLTPAACARKRAHAQALATAARDAEEKLVAHEQERRAAAANGNKAADSPEEDAD